MIILDHIVLRYYISIHKDLVLSNNQSVLLSEIAKSVCAVAEHLDLVGLYDGFALQACYNAGLSFLPDDSY